MTSALQVDALVAQAMTGVTPLQTQFPNTLLGNQLQQVAQLIQDRTQLGMQHGFLALSHCGAFAEYAIAFKNEIAPKPKTLSLAEAASSRPPVRL